jgi:hypothetical protein
MHVWLDKEYLPNINSTYNLQNGSCENTVKPV